MTLDDILASLESVAVDYRQRGISCCAQQAEQYALRLREAIKEANRDH